MNTYADQQIRLIDEDTEWGGAEQWLEDYGDGLWTNIFDPAINWHRE